MSQDDVLFGYRLRVLAYAARTSVSEACRVFGIHRSTYYVWRRRSSGTGSGCCARASAGAPASLTSSPPSSKSGSLPSRSATPARGRSGSRASCAASAGAGSSSATTASCPACAATGSRRARSASPSSPATPRPTSPRASPSGSGTWRPTPWRAGRDRLLLRRSLAGTKVAVWQLSEIDVASSFARAELVTCRRGNPTGAQTSTLARRVCADLTARPHHGRGTRGRIPAEIVYGAAKVKTR